MWDTGIATAFAVFYAQSLYAESSNTSTDQKCVDNQGRPVESGDRYLPSRNRPCTECLCIRGNAVLCGIAMCIGQVNCTMTRWNNTICCNPDCLAQKMLLLSDLRSTNPNPNRDYHAIFPGNYYEGGSVFSMDDGVYAPPSGYDMFIPEYRDTNSSSTGVTKTPNLPSPYYPILIGLISCAPVALCIICVNALRKYFAMRHQFPQGTFFPRHTRRHARRYVQEDVPVNTNPTVFVDPPPAYSDLHSSKLKLSEDLPKYEDLLKYERQECHIFATTSSGQFTPPVRMTFRQHSDRCDAEPVVDTRQSSEVISVPQTGPTLAPHGIDNPAHIP